MSAAIWPIEIEENSQFDFYVKKMDSVCVPTDVTGYGAKFQVRAAKASTSPIIYEATVGSGITVQPSGNTGQFQITLIVSEVNGPTWTTGFWNLVIWPVGGSETNQAKRLVEGRATWDPSVVHP